MDELKKYIADTANIRKEAPYIFVTRTGRFVTRLRCNYSFNRAAKKANIKKVTPHMLRATWVTLVKQQGVQDSEIMKVTGHTSSKMIYSYDKTSCENNYTKKFILV
jgi:integrase